MGLIDELETPALVALREILLTGRAGNQATTKTLLARQMICPVDENRLELTNLGRSMLVRGSPALWSAQL
jgi:hypothetical protein